MTVKELIEQLQKFDPEMEVCAADDFFGDPKEIFTVETDTIDTHPISDKDGSITTVKMEVVKIH